MNFKKIAYSEYELVPKNNSMPIRAGALLRFEFDHGFGYADCHPWTQFGDKALSEQLKAISKGEFTRLTSRSIEFAKLDYEARIKKDNLLASLDIPRSHFLITNLDSVNDMQLNDLWTEGFRELKIKVGKDPKEEPQKLNTLFASGKPWSLRFDFNSSLNIDQLREWQAKLDLEIYAKIEYIEDPINGTAEEWFELQDELGVTFARDLSEVKNNEAHYFVRVVKPAVQDLLETIKEEPESVELVVTTYMDHPIGQACAAYAAGLLHKQMADRCLLPGLMHHHVYQPNSFSELLVSRGPLFKPVDGTGFGFDTLLERLTWKPL
jgi:o-succinylbenzoate synthase